LAVILCARDPAGLRPQGNYPSGLSCALMEASFPQGPYLCPQACLGALDCAERCPRGAISLQDSMPQVAEELCAGCGECALHCPRGLIRLIPREARMLVRCSGVFKMKRMDKLCPKGCLGCGLCRKACPAGAVGRRGRRAPPEVDHAACLAGRSGCGWACRAACPRSLPDRPA
jgi:electron transport complex protein RnfB